MRKLLLAIALLLAGSGVAFADGIPQVVNAQSGDGGSSVWTVTVFNDSGFTIQSGEIVRWDQPDADLTQSLRPYVSRPTALDDPYTAGVMQNTCADQTQCDIIVKGVALVRCEDASDAVTAGTLVGTSATTFWLCGDYAYLADNAYLGVALTSGNGANYDYIPVYVNPGWGDT